MNWTHSIQQKLKAGLALAIVFLLVLFTNLIDRNHFSRLQESFASVYKDRLMVENYIFKLSSLINEKRFYLYDSTHISAASENWQTTNQAIDSLLAHYQTTKYTEKETRLFEDFKKELTELENMEAAYYQEAQTATRLKAIETKHQELVALLKGLSDIQIEEGQNLIAESNDVIALSNSFSRFEIIILIVIGVFAQVLVITSKPIKPKFPQKFNLN
ncbi:MCP four helix bundle domain-containing protein [Reichenbachiella carrageenanivorans]|uniref:MCP four helix bundle domain-containing protein n=1 Tax=Reichenbachiella carrageenanivorans TaxID=2979869 RepID=A0ABY6CZ12_9BACT|nr:MCP four helix bundle domain-containing protein [Reichenbachiella carrageenanivorans]UXX78615.1 MCP four helix bundle domain-containing protein [Reichenbachiella carrageenanivorans]